MRRDVMNSGKLGNRTFVTIKDVAKAAGVSIATVSRILNCTGGVSETLEARVREAIETLGYSTNDAARTLKGKNSFSIGLIIPDIQNPFFPALVRSIEDTAHASDHAVLLCNSDGDVEQEMRYIRFLHGKRVDGILLIGGQQSNKSVELAESLQMPIVLLDRRVKGEKLPAVFLDNAHGGRLAVEYLIDCGCQKIAFIGRRSLSSAEERFNGYCEALNDKNIEINRKLIQSQPFTFDGGYKGTKALLKEKVEFDAIFAGNDVMAFGAIACLQSHGMNVPQDIQVVGFDDIWMAKWYNPSLTTLCQPVAEIGQAAVNLLLNLREKTEPKVLEMRFLPQLIIRDSTMKKSKE